MDASNQTMQWVAAARTAMEIEGQAILTAARRLNRNLSEATELILAHSGNLVLSGIGKSGHVARKITATLRSIGMPAVFLHPAEAAHGDLGIYRPGDPAVFISKSGTTRELIGVVSVLRESRSPLVGIIGNPDSPLARRMDVVLDASVEREADPHNLAPTASTVVALSLGHALAVALMEARGFTPEEFGRYHPGGQLGRALRVAVREAMQPDHEVAWVRSNDSLKQVVIVMTARPLGAACVVAQDRRLVGLVTDGDVRRALQGHDDIRPVCAADIMTKNPVTITPDELLRDALRRMEDRRSQISVLPVVEPGNGRCIGLLRLHDIYQVEPG